MRRVVVTGMGMVTPLGCGVEPTWSRLVNAEFGIRSIQSFDVSDLPAKIAGQVPHGETAEGYWNPSDWVDQREQRRVDLFILYGIAAAIQAVEDAGWKPTDEESRERTGVLIGSGIGGLESIYETSLLLKERGPAARQPLLHSRCADQSRRGACVDQVRLRGPNHAVVTACATGAHAIGDAARMIASGRCGCHGGRRGRSADRPPGHRRVRRLARALDAFQRHAREGIAAVGPRPRRLRHGRRRRRSSCSRSTSTRRSAAPRSTPS